MVRTPKKGAKGLLNTLETPTATVTCPVEFHVSTNAKVRPGVMGTSLNWRQFPDRTDPAIARRFRLGIQSMPKGPRTQLIVF